MRPILEVLLIVAVVIGFAFRAQAQNGSSVLVLDVYSVKVPSDVAQEKGFWLWTQALIAGQQSWDLYPKILQSRFEI